MDKAPLVSIIVPVYNVEAYLPKMIDSVLAQTFKDYELILVDDGTPDGSGSICDEAARKDERIHVIHKPNGGSASARNVGMESARGKFFYFMDSDDWIEPDMLRLLVDTAEKYQCMLTITGFCMEYYLDGQTTLYDVSPEEAIYSTAEQFRQNAYKYFYRNLINVPWNKLYLAEPIRSGGLLFPEDYRQWNDVPFNLAYMRDVTSVVVVPGTMYHYICSRPGAEGSVIASSSYGQSLRKKQFEGILELYGYWGVQDEASLSEIYGYQASRLLKSILEIASMPGLGLSEKRSQIREIMQDPQTKESFARGKVKSTAMRAAMLPVRLGSASLCLVEGKLYAFVKGRMSRVFYRMQSRVVNHAETREVHPNW